MAGSGGDIILLYIYRAACSSTNILWVVSEFLKLLLIIIDETTVVEVGKKNKRAKTGPRLIYTK
tara:strand:- start:849 stop:1040 length:192 start_codon:yes stop_codon:yes gene_type:complete